MTYGIPQWMSVLACGAAWVATAGATTVPSLSFNELTDRSELVVAGRIDRSWTAWDAEHKYIWTHYELGVSSALKGSPGATVVISEPGGVVGTQGMNIAGTPVYQTGERVVLFLERMPNGYLRTTGWTQGKFNVDQAGKVHAAGASTGLEIVGSGGAAIEPRALEGMSVAQVSGLVAARARAGRRQ